MLLSALLHLDQSISYWMISLTSAEGSETNKMWWASASALHTSVGGLAGVVGLILVIKRDALIGALSCLSSLPALENIPEEDYLLPGLQNHGSNCFFNVVLQVQSSLYSCDFFFWVISCCWWLKFSLNQVFVTGLMAGNVDPL